jgi:dTDP-glucose 4,6-dehydratase
MSSILVTGGAGFIGGCFVRQLLETNQDTAFAPSRVVNLDKLTYAGNLDSLASVLGDPRHVFVEGDIGNRVTIERVLAEHRPQAIVNFAAESHVDRSIDGPRQFVETNVLGTFEMLFAALQYWESLPSDERGRFRFLHVSTDEVYGSLAPDDPRSTEGSPYLPNSPYAASKASADHFVRAFHQTYKLPVLTTLCTNNYGPFQFPEKLLPLMIANAIEGKPLPVYGDGQQIREWLYVEDHCRAIRTVLERGTPGERYNIGAAGDRRNLEVVKMLCAVIDRLKPGLPHAPTAGLISFVKDRPGHDRRYALDTSKIERELGWKPRVSFEEGLERTVRWYLENEAWVERVTSGAYQRERLGLRGE